ncbi:helix-turn-helix domain-containing protein [Bacillus sp. FJAT-28004]|uniref:helix-turn-helix domain-containing protein n=1 Tax=Bacillus sp. FJAT-28004 TaxID=1679165 RepID=UPI0006B59D4B|nr:helix-turn-helix domain-containing protein [Bacillus sp. FJAT-28004]
MLDERMDGAYDELHFRWRGHEVCCYDLSAPQAPFAAAAHMLWLCHQGAGTILIDGNPCSIRKGQCILYTPKTRVEFVQGAGQTLHVHALSFEISTSGRTNPGEEDLSKFGNRAVSVHPLSAFISMMDTLSGFKTSFTGLDKFKRNIVLQEALHTFLSIVSREEPIDSKDAVEQTISYMQRNFQLPIKLTDLSAMACIGVRQYSHLFKQVAGCSPMDYLYRIRIEKAKKLLRTSSQDMFSVANQVGFRDEFYFSRRFKQQEGVSPSVYAKNRQPRVIGLLYTSHLLALGITPIGAPDYHLHRNDYVRPLLSDIQSFAWSPIDMEAVRAMEPDFILGYEHMTTGEYEQFSQIAEVVRIPWQSHDVYQQLNSVSAVLDMRQVAQAWLYAHLEKVGRVQEWMRLHIGSQPTCAAFVIERDSFRVAGDRNIGHTLYRSLQFIPHPLVQSFIDDYNGTNAFSEPQPFEKIVEYDADWIFVMVNAQDPQAEESYFQFVQTERWQNLTAVRNNRVKVLPYSRWWMYSPLAVDGQLDDILAGLLF